MQVERKGADRTISGKAKLNIALKAAKYRFSCSLEESVFVNGAISDWNIWKQDSIFQFFSEGLKPWMQTRVWVCSHCVKLVKQMKVSCMKLNWGTKIYLKNYEMLHFNTSNMAIYSLFQYFWCSLFFFIKNCLWKNVWQISYLSCGKFYMWSAQMNWIWEKRNLSIRFLANTLQSFS